MLKLNTFLLALLILMTGYFGVQEKKQPTHYPSYATSPDATLTIPDATGVEQQLADMRYQLESIRQQLASMKVGVNTQPEVTDRRQNSSDRYVEQNRAGNDIVNTIIENGVANGSDMVSLHQQVSKMDPEAQQQALQRLVTAINEQRVDVDPRMPP